MGAGEGRREPGRPIYAGRAIAALYSSAKDGQNVAVDYTPVKHFKDAEAGRVCNLPHQLDGLRHARPETERSNGRSE